MREDARHCILEEIQPAASALRGYQPAHYHAAQLRWVGHRGGMWIPVKLDGVVHCPVMERTMCLPLVIFEEPHTQVNEAVACLGGELILHVVVLLRWQTYTWRQGIFARDKDVINEPLGQRGGRGLLLHPISFDCIPIEVGHLWGALQSHRDTLHLPLESLPIQGVEVI